MNNQLRKGDRVTILTNKRQWDAVAQTIHIREVIQNDGLVVLTGAAFDDATLQFYANDVLFAGPSGFIEADRVWEVVNAPVLVDED